MHAQAPYARNEQDGLYRNEGEQLLFEVIADGESYAATFDKGLVME